MKATEKELHTLLNQINEYRIQVRKRPFILGKIVIENKLQRRHKYQLKYLYLKEGDVGTVCQYTGFMSGQLMLTFLRGLLEGVHIGMKIALNIEKSQGVGK